MRKYAVLTSVLLAASLFTGAASAKDPVKPIFLKDNLLDPALLLPVPPTPDSAEGRAQLDEARAIVKSSSPERIKRAAEDDANESVALYSTVLPGFDLSKLPMTAKLFKDVENDQDYVTNAAKIHFARKRPFELDNSIPTCVPSPLGKAPRSYPSGHTTLGFTDGIVLAHLMPAKAETIFARAQDYGYSRVVCGVHFTADTIASQSLATGIAIELMQNPKFQKEFDAAKAELVAAGLTN